MAEPKSNRERLVSIKFTINININFKKYQLTKFVFVLDIL